ncbi:MAG: hypothetical protein WCA19_20745 [Candidatus Acidiferrales bacterium]
MLTMHRFALAILSFALFTSAQTVVVVPSKPSSPVPRMEKGLVDGRTYKNSSIGVELRVAEGLTFGTPELKGTPGTVPLLVTVTAVRNETFLSPRYVTAFYADALAYYPEGQRSTDAYMRKVIKGNQQTGYEAVQETLNVRFGGASFARRDFRGALYEAVLVKSCDAQALVFIFASSGKDSVDKLIGETDLKLDSERSGCHSADPVSK